jgi:tripartite-type tricarboxylate transporter receptor subunit TctC
MTLTFDRRTFLGSLLVPAFGSATATTGFPERPVTLIVPSPPGGGTDFSARLVAEGLGQVLGGPVIVENRPGGDGNLGSLWVAQAPPDGHTLLVNYNGYHVANPHLFDNAGWDPIRDFAAVGMITRGPQVLAINPRLGPRTLADLIARAKREPGKLTYASTGFGSINHIAGAMLQKLAGISLTHVPYRGAGPGVLDMIAGAVDIVITSPAGVVSHVQSGKALGLAVTGSKRIPMLPNVPTAAEAGLSGYELESWFALFAPAKTRPAIVLQLGDALVRTLARPEVQRRAEEAGVVAEAMTPAAMSAFTQAELRRWGDLIRTLDLRRGS